MINKEAIMKSTRDFLLAIGENPDREGLKDTPRRVANMCDELLNPECANLKYTFFESNAYNGIVLIKDIEFCSFCEHHLLPFLGKIHIAYLPGDKVIGISKLARIVDKHSKKLQLQERLSQEIVDDLQEATNAKGIAIYIEAQHLCMNVRGVSKRNATTVTTLLTGEFKRSEKQNLFLELIK